MPGLESAEVVAVDEVRLAGRCGIAGGVDEDNVEDAPGAAVGVRSVVPGTLLVGAMEGDARVDVGVAAAGAEPTRSHGFGGEAIVNSSDRYRERKIKCSMCKFSRRYDSIRKAE